MSESEMRSILANQLFLDQQYGVYALLCLVFILCKYTIFKIRSQTVDIIQTLQRYFAFYIMDFIKHQLIKSVIKKRTEK